MDRSSTPIGGAPRPAKGDTGAGVNGAPRSHTSVAARSTSRYCRSGPTPPSWRGERALMHNRGTIDAAWRSRTPTVARRMRLLVALWLGALCLAASIVPAARAAWPTRAPSSNAGIHKIEHVVVIMQEKRSFDHYFGAFPGADGIPSRNGRPTVCVP